ncbi:tetrapyrrole methylase family protein/MazG family protein [Hydrogenivirga caldilitoris]|uniref:Nucleoside triphosphate pyrophosphohydrolase n=1 Tax=Hydrogenivirga caldilitoris TaxID=246264 RepID=A0A497XW42_9AQUI|nr:nucleoside triphosphate pyrophosphohydrolase [Hydrogenivirga caldilitoris]RLJ70993.1 tetrapyrrole methylase family protein/MazG family protein [Hydrogenivirga caldilitoris]
MEKRTFEELVKVMEELRSKCPWDREQTHESLKKYLIEEAYEVLDAIDSKDDEKLKEELGDLLLQPVFHAQIAKERGAFNIYEVIDNLVKKLIERHPHVFGDANPEEVLKNWEKKKMEGRESVLEGIPKHLPALMRSQKLQDKASQVGFDFTDISQVFEKIEEEINELKESLEKGDRNNIKHEIGDILTAVVELARFVGVDAEEALQEANDRFIRRFSYIEVRAREEGRDLKDMSLEEMDKLWEEGKRKLEGGSQG